MALCSRVDSRYLPEQLRRTLPLASDAVAFLPLVVKALQDKGQEREFGTIWNTRTPSGLVMPTLLYLHKQASAQKQPTCFWPGRPPAVCFFGVFGFRAFVGEYVCVCLLVVVVVLLFFVTFVFSIVSVYSCA